MSAAAAHPCTVCEASSAKYKCPQCGNDGATCSLACSKQHKAERHVVSEGNASQEAGPSSPSPRLTSSTATSIPPLRVKHTNEELHPPAAHRFTNIGRFVPMNQYSDANMLEDFEYLQHVGRSVSAVGRDIAKRGWLRDMEASQQQQQRNSSKGDMRQDGHQQYSRPPTQEERNRHAFETWIRRLRLPIMLLPEGMSARKANTSRWKAQSRQLLLTVEIAYNSAKDKETGLCRDPALMHLTPWSRKISDLVWSDLLKRVRNANEGSPYEQDKELHAVLDMLQGQASQFSDSSESPRARFDRLFCFAIPVHSDKLRNESSNKFLEWWQRQVHFGMVKEGGLELDEEKREAYEKARQARWQSMQSQPQEGHNGNGDNTMLQSQAEQQPSPPVPIPDAVPMSLISSSLLGQLQAAWQAPAAESGASTTDVVPGREAEVAVAAAELASLTKPSQLSRSVLLVDSKDTLEDVLRRLPKGNAIVEYPHIEVWTRASFEKHSREARINPISLEPAADERGDTSHTREVDGTADLTPSKRKQSDSGVLPEPKRANNNTPTTHVVQKVKPSAAKSGAPLVGISAYASSDEDDDTGSDAGADEAVDALEGAHDMAATTDIVDHEEVPVSGLAGIARALGMAPTLRAAATEPETPVDSRTILDDKIDDDAVDFDNAA